MRLTKIMAASLVSLSLTAVPAIAAEKSATKASAKADVRKASKLRGVNRQEEAAEGAGGAGWVLPVVAVVAVAGGIAAATSGGSSNPTSP